MALTLHPLCSQRKECSNSFPNLQAQLASQMHILTSTCPVSAPETPHHPYKDKPSFTLLSPPRTVRGSPCLSGPLLHSCRVPSSPRQPLLLSPGCKPSPPHPPRAPLLGLQPEATEAPSPRLHWASAHHLCFPRISTPCPVACEMGHRGASQASAALGIPPALPCSPLLAFLSWVTRRLPGCSPCSLLPHPVHSPGRYPPDLSFEEMPCTISLTILKNTIRAFSRQC